MPVEGLLQAVVECEAPHRCRVRWGRAADMDKTPLWAYGMAQRTKRTTLRDALAIAQSTFGAFFGAGWPQGATPCYCQQVLHASHDDLDACQVGSR
jgi:hypothetical protein